MALFGQRKSMVWPKVNDERAVWQNLSELRATHIVVSQPDSGLKELQYVDDFEISQSQFLEQLFSNDHFTLYRILRPPIQ